MCGSTELLKQDGVFVCQQCGTKYSVEEAKRMMGAEDVVATPVQTSNNELDNLYQLARRAKNDNNDENAAKYYDMILIKDPTSWEANFFSVYYKAMTCKIGEISSAAGKVKNCIGTTFELIDKYVEEDDDKAAAILEVKQKSFTISEILSNAAENHYNGISASIKQNYTMEYAGNIIAAEFIVTELCNCLCSTFSENKTVMESVGVDILKERVSKLTDDSLDSGVPKNLIGIIIKYDPEFSDIVNKRIRNGKKKKLETEIAELEKNVNVLINNQSQRGCTAPSLTAGAGIAIIGFFAAKGSDAAGYFYIAGALFALIGLLCLIPPSKKKLEEKTKDIKAKIEWKKNQLKEFENDLD